MSASVWLAPSPIHPNGIHGPPLAATVAPNAEYSRFATTSKSGLVHQGRPLCRAVAGFEDACRAALGQPHPQASVAVKVAGARAKGARQPIHVVADVKASPEHQFALRDSDIEIFFDSHIFFS